MNGRASERASKRAWIHKNVKMTSKLLWMQMTAQIDVVEITFYRCVTMNAIQKVNTYHFYQFKHVQFTWSSLEFQLFVYFCQFFLCAFSLSLSFSVSCDFVFLSLHCLLFYIYTLHTFIFIHVRIIFVRISNCVSYTIYYTCFNIYKWNSIIGSLQCAMFRSQL